MDQKKQATTATSKPLGMCEKLFKTFQPALRHLRRLTFQQQEATAASPVDSSPAEADHGPVPQSKLPEPVAPPQGKFKLPKVPRKPKPKHHEKPLPTAAPPKAEVRPLGPVPQPLPPPPLPPKAEVQKPRKRFSEKIRTRTTSVKVNEPGGDTPHS